MPRLHGEYDVLVAGAGITGIIAAIAARRQGANILLMESTGFLGGVLTGGRLTKPHGPVNEGLLREMMERAAQRGGANLTHHLVPWGEFNAVLDPEVMQRVILEMLVEEGVQILLHSQIIDVVTSDRVRGVEFVAKSGRQLALAQATIDATGDGDVAAMAGAQFHLGRPADGKTQPISAYVRLINVDTPTLARYIRDHPDDFSEVVIPEHPGSQREDYVLNLLVTGFGALIQQAKSNGDWALPKAYVSLKTGLIPGEVNLNATRFHGDGLDERVLTAAEIELRKQAYQVVDFFKKYVPGFEKAQLLEIAPKLGVRETRRIVGDYMLTGEEVRSERRFPDSVALSRSGLDIHEPGGEGGLKQSIGAGYGVPYRCLLPAGVEGLLVAGRCISVDETAFGSTRNVPTCAQTGEAAGIAAALASRAGLTPRRLGAAPVQAVLAGLAIPLGT